MPVSNTVSQFREKVIKRGGPQIAGKYRVLLNSKSGSLLCYPLSVVIPGRFFSFYEHDIWGTIRKVPHKRGYTQCNMTFIIYQDWEERTYLENWMNNLVVNKNYITPKSTDFAVGFADLDAENDSGSIPSSSSASSDEQLVELQNAVQTGSSNSPRSASTYRDYVRYDSSVGTIQIECLNAASQTAVNRKILLKEAYPAQISPLALGADATAYPTFTVGFQYNEYQYL